MDGQQVARTSRGRSSRNKCTEGRAWELGWGMGVQEVARERSLE